MAKDKLTFEEWAEQNPSFLQDLGVRPGREESQIAREWDRYEHTLWANSVRELSGPVRKVPVQEYLRQRR